MADFSSVVLVGRLTRDPELKLVGGSAQLCVLSVATSRRFTKDSGERVEQTSFVEVDVWRKAAENCVKFLRKGREILVTGSLRQDRWVDAKTHENRSRLKVVAQTVQFLGKRPEEPAAPESEREPTAETSMASAPPEPEAVTPAEQPKPEKSRSPRRGPTR
jgi:single-strand DNA-binding protein